jgi:glycosyltransferase involved in cell wall biosynthesis
MDEIRCYATFDVYPPIWGAHIRPYYLVKELASVLKKKYIFVNLRKWNTLIWDKDLISFFPTTSIFNIPVFFIKKIKNVVITDISDDPFWQSRDIGTKLPREGELLKVARFLQVNLSNYVCVGDKLLAKKIGINRYIEINNASDPKHFRYSKIPEKKCIVYLGGISEGRGIEMLIDACNYINENFGYDNFDLKIYGKCANEKYREKLINKIKDSKCGVKWIEKITYKEAPKVLEKAYLCVNVPKPNSYFDTGPNIKVFDYMASGRPVVATNCRAQARLIKNERCGVICKFKVESIARAIYSLLKNPKTAEKLGRNGREAIEKRHSWYHRALLLAEKILEERGDIK